MAGGDGGIKLVELGEEAANLPLPPIKGIGRGGFLCDEGGLAGEGEGIVEAAVELVEMGGIAQGVGEEGLVANLTGDAGGALIGVVGLEGVRSAGRRISGGEFFPGLAEGEVDIGLVVGVGEGLREGLGFIEALVGELRFVQTGLGEGGIGGGGGFEKIGGGRGDAGVVVVKGGGNVAFEEIEIAAGVGEGGPFRVIGAIGDKVGAAIDVGLGLWNFAHCKMDGRALAEGGDEARVSLAASARRAALLSSVRLSS